MSDAESEIESVEETSTPEDAGAAEGPQSFDFRRTDRIPKDQFEHVRFVHEQFAKELSAGLTVSLGVAATVSVGEVEQVSFGEMVNRLEPTGCFLELKANPMQAAGVMAFDAGLVFAALELLLGSKGGESLQMERELTEIEKNVLDLMFRTVLENYGAAWGILAPISFDIDKLRQQPQQLECMEDHEPLILASLDVALDSVSGKLQLGFPSLVAQMMLRGRERPVVEGEDGDRAGSAEDRMLQLLAPVPLTLDVRLDGGTVLVRNFASLKPGDVLALGAPVDKPLDCLVNDRLKFKGRVSSSGTKIGFHIDGYE